MAHFNEQIENYEKKLQIAFSSLHKNGPCQSNLKELKTCFESLTQLYSVDNEFEKIFNLIDYTENLLQTKPDLTSYQIEIFRSIGDFLYKFGFDLKALEYYKRSLKLSNDTNLLSLESYENLLNNNIDRWHLRMLNDRIRNRAYSEAIKKRLDQFKVNEKIKILDIGTGTGLLAVQCVSNGSEHTKLEVYACESNELFCEIAKKFIKSINKSNIVKLINKHSNDLRRMIDFKQSYIDFIVTEIFDDGLLGENCLDSFYNAIVANKLVNPERSIKTIPKSAQIYFCAVESEHLRKANYFNLEYSQNQKKIKINCQCLDNSAKFEKNSDELHEPYTTEDLRRIKFKFLSEPIELNEFKIEFDNQALLEQYCKLNKVSTLSKEIKVTKDGQLDAFVIWFDLNLDDEIKITNSPIHSKIGSNCWHHAVYNIPQETRLKKNESVYVDIKLRKDCFLVLPHLDSSYLSSHLKLDLNRLEISLLNNSSYQNKYLKWFEEEILAHSSESSLIRIGFLSNTFNRLIFDILHMHSLKFKFEIVYFINSNEDITFRSHLEKFFANTIRIACLNDIIKENNYSFHIDCLIIEPIDYNYGILKKNLLSDVLCIQNYNKNKIKMYPNELEIQGHFIESNILAKECDLDSNDNLFIRSSYDLKSILNEYKIKHHYSVSLDYLTDMKILSQTKQVFSLNLTSLSSELKKNVEFELVNSGHMTAFLYWYDSTLVDSLAAITFDKKIYLDVNANENKVIKSECLFENNLFHLNIF